MVHTLIPRLAEAARKTDYPKVLRTLLGELAQAVDADYCVFWESEPTASLEPPLSGQMFIQEQWARLDSAFDMHRLPVDRSAPGRAVIAGKPIFLTEAELDSSFLSERALLSRALVKSMACLPIDGLADGKASLNLYWIQAPASPPSIGVLSMVAQALPVLVRSAQERATLKLMNTLDRQLDGVNLAGRADDEQLLEMRRVVQAMCEAVAKARECVECTAYLRSPAEPQGPYRCLGSTWPKENIIQELKGDRREGATAWVLEQGRPARVFDWGQFEDDAAFYKNKYRGLVWRNTIGLVPNLRAILGIPERMPLQPASFVGQPIRVGQDTVGVIRYSAAKIGPYAFGPDDETLLARAADRLARVWEWWKKPDAIIAARSIKDNLFKAFDLAEKQSTIDLLSEAKELGDLLTPILERLTEALPGADVASVRLLDPNSNKLSCVAYSGAAWGPTQEIRDERSSFPYPVNATPPTSIDDHVYQLKEPYKAIRGSEDPLYRGPFEYLATLIAAPLLLGDRVLGVLNLGCTHQGILDNLAPEALGSLGLRLAVLVDDFEQRTLRRSLHAERDRLNADVARLKDELAEAEKREFHAAEDLVHQLRPHVSQIRARSLEVLALPDFVFKSIADASPQIRQMLIVRSQAARAWRILEGNRIYRALSRREKLKPDISPLGGRQLASLVLEAMMDQELISEPDMRLHFRFDRDGFKVLDKVPLRTDESLLMQAVVNLLDNARKYSYANTEVTVRGGIRQKGGFEITVLNKGLPLEQPGRLTERYFRSDGARATTSEGSGIGLWVAEQIMKALEGDLFAETVDGLNSFRLLFRSYP